jgi:Sulfotransferase family
VAQCHQLSPNARVFLLLRNPIYRDWSSLLMEATMRHNFDAANASFIDLMVFYDRTKVSQYSNYAQTYSLWHQKYGSQLLVGLYDDIVSDPHSFYQKLCNHCGLDPDAFPDWRNKVLRRVFKGPGIALPPQMHEFLHKKYRPMIEKLQILIEADLSDWLSDAPKVQ